MVLHIVRTDIFLPEGARKNTSKEQINVRVYYM